MKKILLTVILLTAGLAAAAAQQQAAQVLSTIGWQTWGGLEVQQHAESGIIVSGAIGRNGGGYVIESTILGLTGKRRIILEISGITNTDTFDAAKLLKLEINNEARRVTSGGGSMNINDPDFINAANGRYIFDISSIRDIRKINIVFYNSTFRNIRIVILTE